MKTYILCADVGGIKIYNSEELEQAAQIFEKGGDPSALADALECMCGVGTVCRLVLWGEPRVLNQLCQGLSDQVRGRIVGIIPEVFSTSTLANVSDRSQRASEGKYLLVS